MVRIASYNKFNKRKHRKKINRCSVQCFWREIATCTHFRCRGQRVQSAGHTLGVVSTLPADSEGGAPVHIVDACAGVGWSQLLRPYIQGSGVATADGMFNNNGVGTSESLFVILEAAR